jgi:hypothetical protein
LPKSNSNWTFGRGIVMSSDRMHVLSFPDIGTPDSDTSVTQIVGWTPEEVTSFMIPWEAKSLCYSAHPGPHVVIMGPFGDVLISTPGGNSQETVDGSETGPVGRGVIRDLRLIGRHVYATGMSRQVYRREPGVDSRGPGVWRRLDAGVVLPAPSAEVRGFNSIDGFSEEDIYAGGWQGEVWHYNGQRWRAVDSPTDLKLERVVCGEDGNTYAVGQVGVILRGRGEQWNAIPHEETREQFWGAEWYRDRLWLATQSGVFVLTAEDTLKPVEFGLAEPPSCRWLAAGYGVLWSIGANHLLYTRDGVQWTQLFL